MTDNRKSGIALIAGSVGGLVTMAFHPTAGGMLSHPQVDRLSLVSGIVHSIGLVSVVVLFLGACGLARSIARADRSAFAGIVIFGFACFAIFIAATVSGFIIPAIIKQMAQDAAGNQRQWQIVINGIFQINQAFAQIYSVAASVAVILWSVSALRSGALNSRLALYGCLISVLIIVGVGVGHLRLNVHGMAVVWIGQAIWFILVGYQLCSQTASAQATQ